MSQSPNGEEDDGDDASASPLESLLVSEIGQTDKQALTEALDGLIGITRETHNITLRDPFRALENQDRVVGWMLARYAKDLTRLGHLVSRTDKTGVDEVAAACDIHPADVRDAALGNGDLRLNQQANPPQVVLPYERMRHAAEMMYYKRHGTPRDGEGARPPPGAEEVGDGG